LIPAIALLLTLTASGQDSTGSGTVPGDWELDCSMLFMAKAGGMWSDSRPSMDSTLMDAAFSVHALSREVDILAVAAAKNSPSSDLYLRRAGAEVKWPGTPWIGGGVHYSDRIPFLPGLRSPVVEWGWLEPDSISGFSVSGGGILGFSSEYLLQEVSDDTLQQFTVSSPWMGFTGADYRRMEFSPGDSSAFHMAVNVLEVRTDFRYVRPRLVLTGGDGGSGRWGLSCEILDLCLLDTGWGRVEVVPGARFAGDSVRMVTQAYSPGQRVLFLGSYLRSRRHMVSAGLEGMIDLESDSLSGISARAGMVDREGVTWDIMLDIFVDGDHRGCVKAGIADSFAAAGMMLEVLDDSSRVTGSAAYSPRRDVCAEVFVSGDLDDSLQPSCRAVVSSALGPVRGLVSVDWAYDCSPVFGLELRGLLK